MAKELVLPGFEELTISRDISKKYRKDKANGQHLRGQLAELLFDCLGTIKKWQISIPTSAFLPYDRIAIIDGKYKKIQIKTAYLHWRSVNNHALGKKWIAMVSRRRSSRHLKGRTVLKYQIGDYDLLFIPSHNYCYLIPFEAIAEKTCLYLDNGEYDQYIICKISDIFRSL